MDGFGILIFFLIPFLLFCLCGFCCRSKQRGIIFSTPVVVTSATHTAPGGYPTGVQTVSVYPTSTSGYQQTAYPQQAPYPVMGAQMAMPMPMQQAQMNPNPIGMNPQPQVMAAPYPPNAAPYAQGVNYNYSMNPPSYDNAVASNQVASHQAAYEKQSPYNPGYTTGY